MKPLRHWREARTSSTASLLPSGLNAIPFLACLGPFLCPQVCWTRFHIDMRMLKSATTRISAPVGHHRADAIPSKRNSVFKYEHRRGHIHSTNDFKSNKVSPHHAPRFFCQRLCMHKHFTTASCARRYLASFTAGWNVPIKDKNGKTPSNYRKQSANAPWAHLLALRQSCTSKRGRLHSTLVAVLWCTSRT